MRSGSEHEDPLAADRRTMVVAAVVMVGLIVVGVGSAALFTVSACRVIAPEPASLGTAGTGVEEVLAAAFPEADDTELDAMLETVTALAGSLGPVSGIADVGDADRLAALDDGVVALGPRTTALDPVGSTAVAAVDLDPRAFVAGDGETLYSLALVNELTGQIDALLPMDSQLDPLTCVDTATVGTPLAFHLDAGDGELLLLRVEEDGDDARVELRDPVAGRLWASPIEVGQAPAGVLGERIGGLLGPHLVVIGARTTAEEQVPVITTYERGSGVAGWTVHRADLGDLLPRSASWVDVVTVTDELVVVLISPETSRGAGVLAAFDVQDGALAWNTAGEGALRVVDAVAGTGAIHVVLAEGDSIGLAELAVSDGNLEIRVRVPGAVTGTAAPIGDRSSVLLTGQGIEVVDDAAVESFASPFVGRDVLRHPGGLTLLLGGPGSGAVALTFAD